MTWANLRTLGYVSAFLLLGAVITALYGALRTELEASSYIGFIGGVVLGAVMVAFLFIVMLVPERRRTAWVEAITTVNAKYLFLVLIIAWALAMGFLASMNLEVNTVGVPALIGLFAGIFIFMGFIWSVIGE
ncbi:MAG: hypothetical protein AB1Z67_05810 [Candidatus Limnocylindrales bacterium]